MDTWFLGNIISPNYQLNKQSNGLRLWQYGRGRKQAEANTFKVNDLQPLFGFFFLSWDILILATKLDIYLIWRDNELIINIYSILLFQKDSTIYNDNSDWNNLRKRIMKKIKTPYTSPSLPTTKLPNLCVCVYKDSTTDTIRPVNGLYRSNWNKYKTKIKHLLKRKLLN